ncbi:hypothetical protein F5Y03DRAFT_409666 [Xylaria venustula]|nr:hypothetical protein F5Y03DRAFT_409666 [Xylaria venustula]
MTTTVKANIGILEYAVETLQATYNKLRDAKNLLYSITFEAMLVSPTEQSTSRGRNSLSLKLSDGWEMSSDNKKVYDANEEVLQTIEAKARDNDSSSGYLYMNYAFTHQDSINS